MAKVCVAWAWGQGGGGAPVEIGASEHETGPSVGWPTRRRDRRDRAKIVQGKHLLLGGNCSAHLCAWPGIKGVVARGDKGM